VFSDDAIVASVFDVAYEFGAVVGVVVCCGPGFFVGAFFAWFDEDEAERGVLELCW